MRNSSLLLLVSTLFLFGSLAFFLSQYYKTVVASGIENKGEILTLAKEETAVLGVQAEPTCLSEEVYRMEVERLRPALVLIKGSEQQRMRTSVIRGCVAFKEEQLPGYACPMYVSDVDEECVQRVLQKESTFLQPREMIGSSRYGVQVESRVEDSVVDYSLLAEQVATVYRAYTQYATIHSKSATIKDLVVEVPMNNEQPGTDGKFATRYIEVDGSRQLVFVWENGVYKTYHMSGAYAEFNPVGVHKILNKSPNAWSSTALKWMPYWMAFAADPKQKSMLGFHSLVYWYAGYKQTGASKIWEPETNIGTPRSTGCMRLSLEEAKALYYWARVGDWVVIHQ